MTIRILLLCLLLITPAMADVLHLKDGRRVRGNVLDTSAGARIEIATLDGILSIAREDLLLFETGPRLRQTISALETAVIDDPDGLLRLGRFALEKGMFEEALALFDRALAMDGGNSVTVPDELLRVPVQGIGWHHDLLPDDALCLLITGHDAAKPATRLVTEQRLIDLARGSDVTMTLLSGLAHPKACVRLRAARVLAELRPAGGFQALLNTALADRSAEVRRAALPLLLRFENRDPLPVVARALERGDRALRSAALDGLEFLADPRSLGALTRALARRAAGADAAAGSTISSVEQTSYVSGFDVDVANSAFIANPNIGVLQPGHAMTVKAVAVSTGRYLEGAERARAVALMEALSGERFGDDAAKWDRWLKGR